MAEILAVNQLRKSYGPVPVLKNVSFCIQKGEIYGLLGHNGAGKSTTIDCILGIKKPDAGEISLLGRAPGKNKKSIFEKIGVQFQHSYYQKKIRVRELCALTAAYYRHPADWKPLLSSFGLAEKENMVVEKLSGGEKQKLSVLLTLIPNPEIVFLDELTTGLDTVARRHVWKELAKLKQKGVTVLLTSHYMDEVEALCDGIGILANGEMITTGTVKQVVENSGKSTLEEAYLWYTGEEEDENI